MNEQTKKKIEGLITRMSLGDKSAFVEIYNLTYKTQYSIACMILDDQFLAEDILQEVYLKLYINLDKIEKSGAFNAYLCHMTRNACINYKRKNYVKLENAMEDHFFIDHRDPKFGTQPEGQLLQRELGNTLFQALKALPEEERTVLLLRFYEKMKIKEIATITDCSISTVKRRISSGRDHLKEELHDYTLNGFIFAETIGTSIASNLPKLTKEKAKTILSHTLNVPEDALEMEHLNSEKQKKPSYILKNILIFLLTFTAACGLLITSVYIVSHQKNTSQSSLKQAASSDQKTTAEAINTPHIKKEPPILLDYNCDNAQITAHLSDSGVPIDYAAIYAVTKDGQKIAPASITPEAGIVIFNILPDPIDIYISDIQGTTGISTITPIVPEN